MKITIKCRWNETVLFEGEFESTKHAVIQALKDGANLDGANLYGANLDGANLTRANLDGANLYGANLYGANLYGEKLIIPPIQISGLRWLVLITPEYLKIGCQRHTHKKWEAFKRPEITPMADKAWDWWKEHKPLLMSACALHVVQATKIKNETV